MTETGSSNAALSSSNSLVRLGLLLGLVAGVGVVGSVSLSLVLKLKACPLCFYQRSFVMALFSLITLGLATKRDQLGFVFLLSLPLAWAGLGVAAFHEYLVFSGTLECPAGLWGLGTAPRQSLVLFLALTSILGVGCWRCRRSLNPLALTGTIVLGSTLAWLSVASAPPLPKAPSKPYDPQSQPLDMCRPPYQG